MRGPEKIWTELCLGAAAVASLLMRMISKVQQKIPKLSEAVMTTMEPVEKVDVPHPKRIMLPNLIERFTISLPFTDFFFFAAVYIYIYIFLNSLIIVIFFHLSHVICDSYLCQLPPILDTIIGLCSLLARRDCRIART